MEQGDRRVWLTDVYADLRKMVLHLDPESAGIRPTPEHPHVWGVVMDWRLDEAMATIVSLADGTTSMYLSTGGGSIGAGQHPDAAAASVRAVSLAESMVGRFPRADDAPLPRPGNTALVVLTFDGLRRVEVSTAELASGTSPFAPVANEMQNVIYQIRRAEEEGPADHTLRS